jgi:hypothetical protein
LQYLNDKNAYHFEFFFTNTPKHGKRKGLQFLLGHPVHDFAFHSSKSNHFVIFPYVSFPIKETEMYSTLNFGIIGDFMSIYDTIHLRICNLLSIVGRLYGTVYNGCLYLLSRIFSARNAQSVARAKIEYRVRHKFGYNFLK